MSDTANLVAEVEEERAQEEPKTVEKTKEYKYKAPQRTNLLLKELASMNSLLRGSNWRDWYKWPIWITKMVSCVWLEDLSV